MSGLHHHRIKRRISIVDEQTLRELWHVRLSPLGAVSLLVLLFVLALGLLSLLIVYTPVRNILPGYSADMRQQLVVQTSRIDSLGSSLEVQRRYLDIIREVTAGQVQSDTVQTLDSLQLIMREQLLIAKSEATEEFVAQYEQKEKDNLQLFDIQNTIPVVTLFRPVHGVVTEHYAAQEGQYHILVATPDKENVSSVLAGTLVYVNHELNDTYTLIVQHANYMSIYRNAGRVLKRVGDVVQAGESIAMVNNGMPLGFELWKDGEPVNPEEVIVW
ncbi:MAG: M23 family metallopeptidase [Paludibacteraceae bacterium]|nr:M23 family metallopeptidase [Paludibacteraceae bacterium]